MKTYNEKGELSEYKSGGILSKNLDNVTLSKVRTDRQMIAVKDMRHGNWVMVDGEQLSIDGLGMFAAEFITSPIDVKYCQYEYLEPITLTAEILKKCGFEYIPELMAFADKNHVIYECGESGEFWWKIHFFCTNDPRFQYELKYLHELQNLNYFATGEELEYNL